MQDKKCVFIVWVDAMSITSNVSWMTEEEAIKKAEDGNWEVSQVGWIIKKTTDYILLASRYTEDGKDFEEQFGNIFKIPHPWIQSLTELKL